MREGKSKEEKKEAKEGEVEELNESIKEPDATKRAEQEARIKEIEGEIQALKAEIEVCDEKLLPKRGSPTLDGIDLTVNSGNLTCIVGCVGSGKSSLLSAILNEMECERGQVLLCGTVAYCPQDGIFRPASGRISSSKSPWMKQVSDGDTRLRLGRDLEDLRGKGDLTEIGEKGLNLSGGQRLGSASHGRCTRMPMSICWMISSLPSMRKWGSILWKSACWAS